MRDDTEVAATAAEAAQRQRQGQRANESGNSLLLTGLGVGAIGLAGAALGAVCPLCVVATPALLSVGAVQKLRAKWLTARAPLTPAGDEG